MLEIRSVILFQQPENESTLFSPVDKLQWERRPFKRFFMLFDKIHYISIRQIIFYDEKNMTWLDPQGLVSKNIVKNLSRQPD